MLDRTARILADWTPMYPDPISVRAGETVTLGGVDPEWPGWTWCTDARGKSGWTPDDFLEMSPDGETAAVLHDFTARELRVRAGDSVVLIRLQSNWYWVRDAAGGEGWVPATHVRVE